jgi:hypothetical protein
MPLLNLIAQGLGAITSDGCWRISGIIDSRGTSICPPTDAQMADFEAGMARLMGEVGVVGQAWPSWDEVEKIAVRYLGDERCGCGGDPRQLARRGPAPCSQLYPNYSVLFCTRPRVPCPVPPRCGLAAAVLLLLLPAPLAQPPAANLPTNAGRAGGDKASSEQTEAILGDDVPIPVAIHLAPGTDFFEDEYGPLKPDEVHETRFILASNELVINGEAGMGRLGRLGRLGAGARKEAKPLHCFLRPLPPLNSTTAQSGPQRGQTASARRSWPSCASFAQTTPTARTAPGGTGR